jgi:hypothetical protein
MISIGMKILRLVGKTDAPRWMAAAAAVFAILTLCGATWGVLAAWDWWDDRQAVNDDRAKSNAEFRAKQLEAERSAGGLKRERDAAEDEEQEELEDEVEEAGRDGRSAADDLWDGGLFD